MTMKARLSLLSDLAHDCGRHDLVKRLRAGDAAASVEAEQLATDPRSSAWMKWAPMLARVQDRNEARRLVDELAAKRTDGTRSAVMQK